MSKKFRLTIDLSIEETDLKYTLQSLKYELNDALKRVDPGFSLTVEETQEDTKSELLYTANQPIWYDTGCGNLQATFLEYIGMTVRIRSHGSIHPQHVDISRISPRDEEGPQQ